MEIRGAYAEPLWSFERVGVGLARVTVRLYGNRVEEERVGLFGHAVRKLYLSDVAEVRRDGAKRVTLVTRIRTARTYEFRKRADAEVFCAMLDGLL